MAAVETGWWGRELNRKDAALFGLYVGAVCGAFVGSLSPRPLEGSLVGAVLMGIGCAVNTVIPRWQFVFRTRRSLLLVYGSVTLALALYFQS